MTTPPAPPPLTPLDEHWDRALAVVAHPDDLEFGAAAAVARWTGQGKRIGYIMVTSGEAGIDSLHPEECRTIRQAEQIESARLVGVDTVEFLGFPDGIVEYGVPLRAAIAAAVRQYRPEIVITGNFRDTFGGVNLNQADHIAVGRGVLDAVRDAGNRWVFHDQLVDGLEPWGACVRYGPVGPRWPSTASTRPTPSRPGWPRLPPTRRISTGSAGKTSIPPSSSRASRAARVLGWGQRWPRPSRSSRWDGEADVRVPSTG